MPRNCLSQKQKQKQRPTKVAQKSEKEKTFYDFNLTGQPEQTKQTDQTHFWL